MIPCQLGEQEYTRGWRLRRDDKPEPIDHADPWGSKGWRDADAAIDSGRDISWSRTVAAPKVAPIQGGAE